MRIWIFVTGSDKWNQCGADVPHISANERVEFGARTRLPEVYGGLEPTGMREAPGRKGGVRELQNLPADHVRHEAHSRAQNKL